MNLFAFCIVLLHIQYVHSNKYSGLRGSKELDEDEFLRLLKQEEGKLFRVALAVLGNEEDAWDSMQQTVERAWTKRSTLKGGAIAFPAWIKRILVNQSLNIMKARKRVKPIDPQEMMGILEIPQQHGQDITLVWEVVRELGEEHRKVIILRYLGDLKLNEIARELGISLGTVKSRLNTAHTRMRQKLQEDNLKGAK
jgi:RNA polymerase sigma-70 factor (ECF subfamily)